MFVRIISRRIIRRLVDYNQVKALLLPSFFLLPRPRLRGVDFRVFRAIALDFLNGLRPSGLGVRERERPLLFIRLVFVYIIIGRSYKLGLAIAGSTITLFIVTIYPTLYTYNIRTNQENLVRETARVLAARIVWVFYTSTLNKDSISVRRAVSLTRFS